MSDLDENTRLGNVLAHNLDNALSPLSNNVGTTLGDLWYLAFGGISQKAEIKRLKYHQDLEKLKQETYDKLIEISSDDYKEPDIQIAGQALEKSKYCVTHEELRNMFSSLIASSAMKSKADVIHPSFADIIQKMSPDDAFALSSYFAKYGTQEIIDIRLVDKRDSSFKTLLSNVWLPYSKVEDLIRGSVIISSLSRLGLIEVRFDQTKTDDTKYNQIFNNETKEHIINQLRQSPTDLDNHFLQAKKGVVGITDFGAAFLECVT